VVTDHLRERVKETGPIVQRGRPVIVGDSGLVGYISILAIQLG
jgi:hypothetical protein